MGAKTLKQNYQANLDILKENIRRGLTASQAIEVIENWRIQFVSHNLYGEDEKEFINKALELVEPMTKMAGGGYDTDHIYNVKYKLTRGV